MEDLENASGRLDNIGSVEPILGALRTISLGSWQTTLAQRTRTHRYAQQLTRILVTLLAQQAGWASHGVARRPEASRPQNIVLLAVGSERGLCGHFNAAIVERTRQYLAEATSSGLQVNLHVVGTRLVRFVGRTGYAPAWTGALSVTSLPPVDVAFDLTERWLADYQDQTLDAVDVLYNTYKGMGAHVPTVMRLIPPDLQLQSDAFEEAWPPPHVETDPWQLLERIIEQQIAIRLYEILLESAASEHSARYQLAEAATQNAKRLIEELTLALQSARRQAITRELQELAAGAGLLGSQRR